MASSSEQANNYVLGVYQKYMGPRNILVPFHDRSTPAEVREILRKLHSDSPEKIRIILGYRKKWLQKLIHFLDIEVSFYSFTPEAVHLLRNDFVNHIYRVVDIVDKISKGDPYIGQGRMLVDSFDLATSQLDLAIKLGNKPKDIQEARHYKSKLYEYLRNSILHLENGLGYWGASEQIITTSLTNQPRGPRASNTRLQKAKANIEETIEKSRQEIDLSKQTLDSIIEELAFDDISKPTIYTIERALRLRVLASLIKIPEKILLEDSTLVKLIEQSRINTYIYRKDDVIQHLRKAKVALNLAFDECGFIEEARMDRDELYKHKVSCISSLRDALGAF